MTTSAIRRLDRDYDQVWRIGPDDDVEV